MYNISKSMKTKVKAAPKKGKSHERGNHRPLSILRIPSKVHEGIRGGGIDNILLIEDL